MLAAFTRLLSAEQYGNYVLVMAAASILSGTFFGWIGVAANRYYPYHRDQSEVIGAAVFRGFALSISVAGIVGIFILLGRDLLMVKWFVIAAVFVVMVAQGWYDIALQSANSQGSPVQYGLIAWTRAGISLVAGTVLVRFTDSAYGALGGLFLGAVVAAMLFNPFTVKASKKSDAHKALAIQLFEYGFPLTFTFLSMLIVGNGDRLLLGWLQGPAAAAPYAAAYDLVQQAMGALMSVLFLSAFPSIVSELDRGDEVEALAQTKVLGRMLVCVGAAAAVGLSMLSTEIASLVFGIQFRDEAAKVIPWIAFGIGVGCFKNLYLDLAFQFRRVTKIQGYVAVSVAILNLLLNILLIPIFGTRGAAGATLVAFLLGAVASRIVGRRFYDLPLPSLNELAKILCGCFLMMAFLHSVSDIHIQALLLVKILLAALVYCACLWGLNFGGVRNHSLRRYFPWRW